MNQNSQPIKTPFFYGWTVVALAAVGVFFSGPGQTYSVSVFIESYIKEFEMSRSAVSSVYSAATLLAGLLLFIVGRLVDRFGQRAMMASVGLMLGLAALWNSMLTGPVMMFIGFFAIRLFGQGSLTLIPNTLVPQWFLVKRGRALSFMAIVGFLSSALLPPLNAYLIEYWGWRSTWIMWGVLLIAVFVPLVLWLVRNKPEDIGLYPDNLPPKKLKAENRQKGDISTGFEVNWTVKEAMRTRAFWLILFCVSIPALVNTGLTFHLISILKDSGLEPTMAAFVLSLMAIVGFPVTFASGFLVERIAVRYLLALSFAGHVISMIILLMVNTPFLAIVYGIVWGMVNGFERITLNIVWPNYFGREHLGSIKGIASTTMVIGSAFGPLPFGIAYDMFGSYTEIIMIVMLLPLLGAIAALAAPPPRAG
ncbi:MFS transporter [Bacillus marinisedimentorum]|uniref:MFS transporter n=1 Tax=Bacillus marinisedimentorum TaxID=1821260 RepID=UPI000872AB99|nr:MFS transporter [Bacillus marinisedimentorum]